MGISVDRPLCFGGKWDKILYKSLKQLHCNGLQALVNFSYKQKATGSNPVPPIL